MKSFDQVMARLDAIEREAAKEEGRANSEGAVRAPTVIRTAWPIPQVLEHCAQSIEYSITGYPKLMPWIFRATIGRMAKRKFLADGELSHDVAAPVLGAPGLSMRDTRQAAARLRSAISSFRVHEGPFAPHLAYGPCTKEEYEALHSMHVADHLRAVP